MLEFVDFHLQPIVTEIPAYVRDTKDFLNKIKAINNVPRKTNIIKVDIRSLYTNIINSEGTTAATRIFKKNCCKESHNNIFSVGTKIE